MLLSPGSPLWQAQQGGMNSIGTFLGFLNFAQTPLIQLIVGSAESIVWPGLALSSTLPPGSHRHEAAPEGGQLLLDGVPQPPLRVQMHILRPAGQWQLHQGMLGRLPAAKLHALSMKSVQQQQLLLSSPWLVCRAASIAPWEAHQACSCAPVFSRDGDLRASRLELVCSDLPEHVVLYSKHLQRHLRLSRI